MKNKSVSLLLIALLYGCGSTPEEIHSSHAQLMGATHQNFIDGEMLEYHQLLSATNCSDLLELAFDLQLVPSAIEKNRVKFITDDGELEFKYVEDACPLEILRLDAST